MNFTITHTDSATSARVGILSSSRGKISTPVFMPVGTYGAVKTITPDELKHCGSQIILGNTYHLYLRPGTEVIEKAGGLHAFNGWDGPILTDSGGFQVFSLARMNHISDEGVEFQSHLDGSRHVLTPDLAMKIQLSLGSDILMAFDECPPGNSDFQTAEAAVRRTNLWIGRCVDYLKNNDPLFGWDQTLFPIVQGSVYPDLRRRSADGTIPYATCGIAIGGLAVGEEKSATYEMVDLMDQILPRDQPRYLMGVGKPTDLIRAVRLGVDMFDCVMPTRNARNGQVFTSQGKINIRNSKYREDFTPIEDSCACPACRQFSRAYIRHLLNVNEVLGHRLATLHNITFYHNLMKTMRDEIQAGSFEFWARTTLADWDDM